MEKPISAIENYKANIENVENRFSLWIINAITILGAACIYERGIQYPNIQTIYIMGAGAGTAFIGAIYNLYKKNELERKVRIKIQDASEKFGVPIQGIRQERIFLEKYLNESGVVEPK